jgi:DNA-binding CsgD family transcriptional regulator
MQGRGKLLLTALPLTQNAHQLARDQAKVVIFVDDPAAKLSAGNGIFTVLFGFTPAECRVAEALLAGESPKVIADRFAITENTVRTQIRSLYDKTSTRGMAALIGLLTRLSGGRASDGLATTAKP